VTCWRPLSIATSTKRFRERTLLSRATPALEQRREAREERRKPIAEVRQEARPSRRRALSPPSAAEPFSDASGFIPALGRWGPPQNHEVATSVRFFRMLRFRMHLRPTH
jgi:hypothetical protein